MTNSHSESVEESAFPRVFEYFTLLTQWRNSFPSQLLLNYLSRPGRGRSTAELSLSTTSLHYLSRGRAALVVGHVLGRLLPTLGTQPTTALVCVTFRALRVCEKSGEAAGRDSRDRRPLCAG